MIKFDGAIHTPSALSAEISSLYSHAPDARLVGSLGRSVVYGSLVGNPNHEFDIRGQDPLQAAGVARDIDVLGVGIVPVDSLSPFEVDNTGYSGPFVEVVKDRDDWYLVSQRNGFAEQLHPEVMAPIVGEALFGIRAITFAPQTHLAIYGVNGQMRDKDERTKQELERIISLQDVHTSYPDEFLKPFDELIELNRARLYLKAQKMYRSIMPNFVRVQAVPYLNKFRRIIR
jgi:hypothetical protein